MKRIVYVVLIAAISLSLFTSCQSQQKVVSNTDKVAQEIAANYKKLNLKPLNDGKPLTLKVYLGDIIPTLSETPTPEQPDVFNSTEILRKAFQIIYPNITIEWARTVDTSGGDAFLQYMNTQLNANTAPDIVFAWGSSFAYTDWYFDFNSVLDKPNPFVEGNVKWRDQFPKYFFDSWNLSDAKDRVVALPISMTPGTATAIYYNKAMFSDLNIQSPQTWEQMFAIGDTIKNAGKITFAPWGSPGSGNRKIETKVWDVQFSLGPQYASAIRDKIDYNSDGALSQSEKLRASYEGYFFLTNDYARDMWAQVKRKYSKFLDDGYQNTDYETKWLLGKVAMLEDGLWRLPTELSNTERAFDFGMFPAPAISTDTTKYVDKLEYTEKGPYHPGPGPTFNIMLPSVTKHGDQGTVDACVAFLQFLMVPDNNQMIITEQKGKTLSFLQGMAVPVQLQNYFNQPFPKVPSFEWPGGFTDAGLKKMSADLELWVKDQISDQQFYSDFDRDFKKDIEDYISLVHIDTTGWKRAW